MQNTALTPAFDTDFTDLLRNWNTHQELRAARAPLTTLAQSNHSLFRQRLRTASSMTNRH